LYWTNDEFQYKGPNERVVMELFHRSMTLARRLEYALDCFDYDDYDEILGKKPSKQATESSAV
jgi:hypothetical protein